MAINYFQPSKLQEACSLLSIYQDQAKLLAGGTDLLINMRSGKDTPKVIVDLSKLHELKEMKESAGDMNIGSLVTFTELADSELIQAKIPVLGAAARAVGSPQIRNRGTIGGNIANASPAADVVPVLVALNGTVVLIKDNSVREINLQELIIGPYQTTIAADEIITKINLQIPRMGTGMSFAKVGRRNALAISRLNGVCLLERSREKIEKVSLVIGSVTPTPTRFTVVEDYLSGKTASPALFAEAGRLASAYVLKISGRRESSAYKLPVVENLTVKLLNEAWIEASS